MKTFTLAMVGLGALVLNPFYACGGGPSFRYSEQEMRAAIEGTWKVTAPASAAGPARELTVSIAQARKPRHASAARGLITPADACGKRALIREASACTDDSEMPLEIRWAAAPSAAQAAAAEGGVFLVMGVGGEWGEGRLTLSGSAALTAQLSQQGVASEVKLDGKAAMMERIAKAEQAPPR
jgi:hypothetical protein